MIPSDRLESLRGRMRLQGVDFLALGPGAHMGWVSGVFPHADERPCLLCIALDDAAFLMPALEAEAGRKKTDLPIYEWDDANGPTSAFGSLLEDFEALEAKSIVIDETMRADFAALVTDTLPKARRRFCADTIGFLRMRKDQDEYKILKKNALMADQALRVAWADMVVGMTELSAAELVRKSFQSQGAKPIFNIVGQGANGAFPHHQTGDAILEADQPIVMDVGCAYSGYSSDITRMAIIGDPSAEYLKVHKVVEEAVQAALTAARPGVAAKTVDKAARDVISDAGYGEFFVHRTGHGLGVEVHEEPFISASSETILEEGMVFSIEPGVYLPGRFGIRLEDIVILRADGPEILSELPRELVQL